MDFDLNSYFKQLDVMFEKAKKNITKKITKPQPAEDYYGFKKTKLRSLRYELGVMEINMKKMTEREFRKLKEEVELDEDAVKKAAAKLRLARKLRSQKKVVDRLKNRVDGIKTEKTVKNGDKLSGKKEPINLQPELKTDNR
tara:strand:+ start:1285 stop:1707 length:423 start_codon:yes stop_codon:yes gene_type:complete